MEVVTDSLRMKKRDRSTLSAIKQGSLKVLSSIFIQYARDYDFMAYGEKIWTILINHVQRLDYMCIGAEKSPILLTFLENIANQEESIHLILDYSEEFNIIPSIIDCLRVSRKYSERGRLSKAVMASTFSIITNILSYEDGKYIVPHIPQLVSHLLERFEKTNFAHDTHNSSQHVNNFNQERQNGFLRENSDQLIANELFILCDWVVV